MDLFLKANKLQKFYSLLRHSHNENLFDLTNIGNMKST